MIVVSVYHVLVIRLNLKEKGKINSKKNRQKARARENIKKQNPDAEEGSMTVTVSVFHDVKKAKEIRDGQIRTQKNSSYWGKFGAAVVKEESCIRKSVLTAYEAQAEIVSRLREKGWSVHHYDPKNSFVYIINLKESVKKVKRFKKQNPGKGPFKGFLYMGQTTKDPVSERYRIHTVKVNEKKHKHASSIVHIHHDPKTGIAWDLFREHTEPMTKLESLRMEKQLAISYKKEGYATYWS